MIDDRVLTPEEVEELLDPPEARVCIRRSFTTASGVRVHAREALDGRSIYVPVGGPWPASADLIARLFWDASQQP